MHADCAEMQVCAGLWCCAGWVGASGKTSSQASNQPNRRKPRLTCRGSWHASTLFAMTRQGRGRCGRGSREAWDGRPATVSPVVSPGPGMLVLVLLYACSSACHMRVWGTEAEAHNVRDAAGSACHEPASCQLRLL